MTFTPLTCLAFLINLHPKATVNKVKLRSCLDVFTVLYAKKKHSKKSQIYCLSQLYFFFLNVDILKALQAVI